MHPEKVKTIQWNTVVLVLHSLRQFLPVGDNKVDVLILLPIPREDSSSLISNSSRVNVDGMPRIFGSGNTSGHLSKTDGIDQMT